MKDLADLLLKTKPTTNKEDKSNLPVVVRVKSNYYEDSRGNLVMKRTAHILRRRSGWGLVDCLREEISCVNDFLEWLMGEIKRRRRLRDSSPLDAGFLWRRWRVRLDRQEGGRIVASVIKKLYKAGAIKPAPYISETVYEVMMGSIAYGVSEDTSDVDVYAVTIPPQHFIFPHLTGTIPGFGTPPAKFDNYQKHHIDFNEKEYDLNIYGIVNYFNLVMGGNPNMIDSLYVPDRCVLHCTVVGQHMKSNRRKFLSKKIFHTYKGYAYSNLHKATIKSPEPGSKRAKLVEEFGWDVKFGYHIVRLINEAEQIMRTEDLILDQGNEQLKAIRRGEVSYNEVKEYFATKEKQLEELYHSSTLPHKPDEEGIKRILLECLEEYYGSLPVKINTNSNAEEILNQIRRLVN